MKAKDRLTVILCVNATGTCKLPPVIIGPAKNPQCFRRNPPKLPYYQQEKAWNDWALHKHCWNEMFLTYIRDRTTQPVALSLDEF